MIVIGINNTASPLNYSSEGITISANSSLTIPSGLLVAFSQDTQVVSDINANNLSLSDSINTYNGPQAIEFLNEIASTFIGLDKYIFDQNITGSGQTVSVSTSGMGSVIAQASGTFVATLVSEATIDGTNWFDWFGIDNSVVQTTNTITSPDQLTFNACGIQQFRLRCTSYTSGTAIVSIVASQAFGGLITSQNTTAGGTLQVQLFGGASSNPVTASQGPAAGNLASAWQVQPTDGSRAITIKGSNTAAIAGDTAEVVALSPNSPIPTGANNIGVTGVAQASTTSGQKGDLVQGAVTTNAPSYSTGQTDPLSLDTSGLLRVSLKDTPANTNKFLVTADPITFASAQAVTQSSGPWTQNLTQINGSSISLGQAAIASSIPVALGSEDVQDLYITGAASQSSSGNNILLSSAGSGSTDTVAGTPAISYRSFYVQINGSSGIASGAVTFEGSNDNSNWTPLIVFDEVALTATPINSAITIAASTQRYFSGRITFRYMRCRISTSFSGGTVQAYSRLSQIEYVSSISTIAQPTAANLNATVTATNLSTNVAQFGGNNVVTGTGASGSGIPRVTISNDSSLAANQSVNVAQVNGNNTVSSVTGIQDVMPRKRTSTTGLSPNYSANHITSKTTTTPTSATAYVSAIVIACSSAGTSWTLVIQNKEATPKILVPSFTLTVPTTGLPVVLQFEEPILMTSGIDIITGGTTAGTVDVFLTYWQ